MEKDRWQTTIETVEQLRNTQIIWADWMKRSCTGLSDTDKVRATRTITPFGIYLMNIEKI